MEASSEGIATLETVALQLTVNGRVWSGDVPVEEVLLDLLRRRLGLTGTKRSCESQVCGACTVLVDGAPTSSCSHLAFETNGKSVTTIEGLGSEDSPDPIQAAFIRHMGFQCGYCTSGQIMAAKGLLLHNSSPSQEEIADWMSGNICRCGCYAAIAAAIRDASTRTRRG
ncbi:MAG: 2Fe-2S iron-sulfur cluster binding domain-containing protein [Chloroflexi bacterium]|nr:2Fe-2S iron-sulfur cluster binding domain-containing protein [Chloroflexota bacterium]